MEPALDLYRPLKGAPAKVKLTAADPFTPKYVKDVVDKAYNPAEIYQNRVHGRMLMLENAAKDSRLKKERDAKKAKVRAAKERKKLGVLGRRQGTTRELGLWGFDASQAKFALFLPLHHLWMGYMSELLNLPQRTGAAPRVPSGAAMHPKLLKADFNGSMMTVHQSKNIAILGISGIVIQETEGTFKVVTKENKVKVLPKQNSIFTFAVPVYSTLPATHNATAPLPIPEPGDSLHTVLDAAHVRIELHGNQFCFRSADRAGRKFKAKESIEL
ncbi:Rof/RNase P-like protein [Mycena rosella]|uniref:Rof/RNase P-like protein n=1 Tax=Mycena rosella TaxID=1033263 RepID=A0AAD7M6R0_MYCRO|nr:Rof/RNase P-like protein [Mycena rosella]